MAAQKKVDGVSCSFPILLPKTYLFTEVQRKREREREGEGKQCIFHLMTAQSLYLLSLGKIFLVSSSVPH